MELGSSNDDILTEILSRLPTEYLLQLKTVSKGWHRLISDPCFIRIQLERSQNISGFFFQERFYWCDEDIPSLSYLSVGMEQAVVHNTILDFLPEKVVLSSSCNGLICCRSCFPAEDPVIYVCNPSIKEWVEVKWANTDKKDSLALVFNPLSHPVDIRRDFKVVKIHQTETEEDSYLSFEIYSSETGAWKSLEEAFECYYNLFKNHGIFASGFLHWLTDGDHILVIDAEKEQVKLIRLPSPTMPGKEIPEMCIGESGGYLHFIRISMAGLQIWTLENYAEPEWVLKCSIKLDDLEKENPKFLYKVSLKLVRRLTIDELSWVDLLAFQGDLLFMRVSSKVYLYHIKTRKMKELCTLTQLCHNSLVLPTVLPYSMSLVPLGQLACAPYCASI
ncbi:F-box protein At5g49610-like [Macadamia integrifolia]|uniref:F-box protein At5g49610-like n=1 Tax=Macadamia integrifolia TaxID=60698 RepID=UPI001C4E3623|nr:F-box protein At5g49610-like [Macadamia integrifolia]XP_042488039.1 F-box protein At5g49610-like [Macadamia integrifolia]